MAAAVPNIAETKNKVDTRPDLRGPAFWTKLPRHPADKPKNKIAREKVHVVCCSVKPIDSIMGLVSTLQA